MKIGFLTSYRAQSIFEKEYKSIVAHFTKRGHETIHHLHVSIEHLNPLSSDQRDKLFMTFYKELENCEVIFADASCFSTQIGFGISYFCLRGKPVVLLYAKNAQLDSFADRDVYENFENIVVYEYEIDQIEKTLDDALKYTTEKMDKRFTMIFPSTLMAKVEEVSKKRKLPKSVYIRTLIEEDLRKQ